MAQRQEEEFDSSDSGSEGGAEAMPARRPPGNLNLSNIKNSTVTGVKYDMRSKHKHVKIVHQHFYTERMSRKDADSSLSSALLEDKISVVKEDFVETAFFRSVERRLLERGIAVVVGPTGEGKSSNAIMLCDKLRGKGYLGSYFDSLDEIDTKSIARCRKNLCVVIDNVFGTSILDATKLDRWTQVLKDLVDVQTAGRQEGGQGAGGKGGSCRKKSLLLLLLSRDNVFSEALDKATKLPLVLRDQTLLVSVKSAKSLQKEEKRQLVRKYAGKIERGLSEEEEDAVISADVPIGFPQVCRLYYELKAVHGKPVEFFSRPIAVVLETLKEMMKKDVMVRAALALLVLQGNSVPLQSLELPDKREACGILTALGIIGKQLGDLGSEDEACEQLLKTMKTQCEGLLTLDRGRVSFSHDSVRDAVCVALADCNLLFVVGHCSLAVLSQCILLDDFSSFCEIHNQSVLAVPRGRWPLFTKRLVSELEKGKCREVFTCGLLSHPGFCSELSDACLKSSKFSEMIHEVDVDCGLNFLFWASMVSPSFLTPLLPRCQFKDGELWQGIVGCCVKGHVELIKSMHRSLPRKSVEDWSIPTSSWFSKSQTEDGGSTRPQSRGRLSSTGCRWDDLPVGRHAIPGTVAAEHGHVDVLKTLVELGMPADVRDPKQCTPVMSACSGGQKEAVVLLVTSQKADVTAADSRGSTPLHKLAEGGHDDIACALVKERMDDRVLNECIDKVNDELQTPLMLACRHAPKLAMLLLDKGAETRKIDLKGKSCLHYAAEADEPGPLQKLLDLKTIDVNQVSHTGWSPLHFACSRTKSLMAVQALLRHGAQAKPPDKSSTETPLHVAARKGSLETVQALVESSSDVIAACESVNTKSPFLLACENGNKDVVKYLHNKKANISKRTKYDNSALHYAALSGNVDTVKYVMDVSTLQVNVRNKFGITPLLFACESGKVEVVKHLRERNADLSVVDEDGDTALHYAAMSGNVETVQCVMNDIGLNVNVRNKSGMTPLLTACQYGKVEVVKYLRERNAHLSVADVDGDTALHFAAISGDVGTVQYVVDDIGLNVNVRNKSAKTPLLTACHYGKVEVVKHLRERNADLSVVNVHGNTALHYAAMSGDVGIVQCVMDDIGLNVNVRNKSGMTPLLIACHYGKVEVVKHLRERNADLSVVDESGSTALHLAAISGDVGTVQCVMDDIGLNVNVRNKSAQTPLLTACHYGKVEVVKHLRERNADLSVVNVHGNTALHFAAMSGDVGTVQCVMDDIGLNVNVKNKSAQTPLLTACHYGKVEVVKHLRERNADLSVADVDGDTALHFAAISGDVGTVQCVMDDIGLYVNVRNKSAKTPLLTACHYGKVEVVKHLRERNADLSVVNVHGNTALHYAAMSGDVGTVQCVMDDIGLNVNVRNKSAQTPLLTACHYGKVEVVKHLRESNADLSVVDEDGDTALHFAAMSGDVGTVQCVMDDIGLNVNVRNKSGKTPLLRACKSGKVEVVKHLRERNADLSVVDEDGDTALHYAAMSGDVGTVQCVIDDIGLNVNVRNKSGKTPLLRACARGKVEVVKHLRERNADLSVVDEDGDTALHWAAWSGNVETVQYVMDDIGLNVNVRNKSGMTPLLLACALSKVEVVKHLRERNADLSVVDKDGDTALHFAAMSGDVGTVQCVIDDIGLNVNVRNKSGMTPLLRACARGKVEVVKRLRERNADLSVVDEDGDTALHWAAWSGNVETVQYVMDDIGLNVNVRNKSGMTPLLLACALSKVEVVKHLRERNADLSVVDEDGDTALHYAAMSGDVGTVQCVMDDIGLNVNVRNKSAKTPLLLSCALGKVEVVKHLRERNADLSVVDEKGWTALHFAAMSGDVGTVQCVMDDIGLNVNVRNKSGMTPLLLACALGKVEVVKHLRERNADLSVVDEDGDTALHYAAMSGDVGTVQCVMDDIGLNVNVRNKSGNTPLLRACAHGKVEVVKHLRESNADFSVVDEKRMTALHWAAKSGDLDTVRYLVEGTGMEVVRMKSCGRTPASMAHEEGHTAVAEYLNEKGQTLGNKRRGLKPHCLLQ